MYLLSILHFMIQTVDLTFFSWQNQTKYSPPFLPFWSQDEEMVWSKLLLQQHLLPVDCSSLCAVQWRGTKSGQATIGPEQHIPFKDVLPAACALFFSRVIYYIPILSALIQPPREWWASSALNVIKNEWNDTKISNQKQKHIWASLLMFPIQCKSTYSK